MSMIIKQVPSENTPQGMLDYTQQRIAKGDTQVVLRKKHSGIIYDTYSFIATDIASDIAALKEDGYEVIAIYTPAVDSAIDRTFTDRVTPYQYPERCC